jgi:hypothetical protein
MFGCIWKNKTGLVNEPAKGIHRNILIYTTMVVKKALPV